MKPLIVTWLLVAASASAYACNIPVFRYALERWRPDSSILILFHDGPLTEEQTQQIRQLEQASSLVGGPANVEVERLDIGATQDQDGLVSLWKDLSTNKEIRAPYLLLRTNHNRRLINSWQGTLTDAMSSLVDSPIRKLLRERLLNGDSIIWLILKSAQTEKNAQLRQMLTEQFDFLSKKLKLPEGIGLPGSELHSEVPLFLKFSLIEIDPNDSKEQFLCTLFRSFQPSAVADGQPLVIPVFGRGRALEVIPAKHLDANLVEELTLFLCGACSCQVKESNPGFDLLLSAAWDRELFGEDGFLPPPPKTVADADQVPKTLPIPPGRKR